MPCNYRIAYPKTGDKEKISSIAHKSNRSSGRHLRAASRLREAKRYLIESDYSIERISELVGFSSPQPLFRLFQQYGSMNPNEFRRLHRSE